MDKRQSINKKKIANKLKYIFLGLAIIILVTGVFGRDFIVNLFTKLQMDELVSPVEGTRLLVVAPHCDDETLGCGNLISKTIESGGTVKVVLLTNGDGHTSAVALNYLTVKPNAKNYISSAYLRQDETERAMKRAGVDRENIIYLGYPDGGLYHMWGENWDENNLYVSRFTKCSHSPYSNSYKSDAPYCGKSIADDLESIVMTYNPSIIAFPHPNDRHPDHFAAYCLVRYVLAKNNMTPDQYLYLVHRGKWPSPFGQFSKLFLVPPKKLVDIGTKWVSSPMSDIEQKQKADMLSEYKSQMNVNSPFLKAFIRQNELFGIYPDLEYDFSMRDGPKILLLEDPVSDKIKQNASKSADIKNVYLSTDSSNMHLFLDTVESARRNINYYIDMYFFSSDGKTFRINMTVNYLKTIDLQTDTSENIASIDGLRLMPDSEMLHIKIPYSGIPDFDSILIGASTSSASNGIDRTAWRLVKWDRGSTSLYSSQGPLLLPMQLLPLPKLLPAAAS
ncbi:MAG TPA: PIG-L family deacetylase [Clostridiales bacterium]|nr:PIG-L family deacetylase [Clostridiales bacterium]